MLRKVRFGNAEPRLVVLRTSDRRAQASRPVATGLDWRRPCRSQPRVRSRAASTSIFS
jgi:hypothetical protein